MGKYGSNFSNFRSQKEGGQDVEGSREDAACYCNLNDDLLF